MSQFFRSSFFENRLSSEFLEPLIGFLAYLETKWWHKNQNVVKISTTTKGNLGWITPSLYMAITPCQNRLESCSSPLKTCNLDCKKFLDWDHGFFVNAYIMRGCLCIFVYIWMTPSFPGSRPVEPIWWLKVFLDSRLQYKYLRGFDGLSSISGSKVKAK